MARIRTIKPEFFTSEQVMEISPLSRLLFIGMWPFCDDHGVHVASTKTLKAEVFPADDISPADIDDLMAELFSQRLVVEYSANGRNYWHVTGWERHQKIEKPNYKHPFPYQQNQIVIKESPTNRRPIADQSTPESKGMESNGDEIKELKTQGAKKPKSPQLSVALIELPSFVLRESWLGFIEMRHKIKKPPTERAAQMLVKKLIDFHNRGFDANEILDQSTVNSWQDLYEPKQSRIANHQNDRDMILAANAAACREFAGVSA